MTVSEVATEKWTVWSCDASVVVTNPTLSGDARELAEATISSIDEACSRFRSDSELSRLSGRAQGGVMVSPTLADLVRGALDAAMWTDGDVDPTLGNDLVAMGYAVDIMTLRDAVQVDGLDQQRFAPPRRRRWTTVSLVGDQLSVPDDVTLDLGATAKAIAADRAATRIADELGCSVLVSIGGDIATAGDEPREGWSILVQDMPEDPSQLVALTAGAAIATSSTQKRRWTSGGYLRHHILDPQLGIPANSPWRSVTVAARTCLHANALSTASIVRGFAAVGWLDDQGVGARFVDVQGRVVTTGRWPRIDADVPETGEAL